VKLLGWAVLLACVAAQAESWNRFRGPNGSGVSADKGFPVVFGKGKNMAWRAAGRPGKSSPVLTRTRVFLTGADDGKLYTQCFDRARGKLLWERFETQPRQERGNRLNHAAALSPVTDGENVYAFFKDYGLVSYDGAGKMRWKAPLGPWTVSMGLGGSPVLAGDTVVMLADQLENSFIAGFSARNGEMKWKTPREEGEGWATPLLFGDGLLLTVSRGLFGAHGVKRGERAATLSGISPAIVASPVLVDGTLYYFGYGNEEPPPFSSRLERLDKNKDGKLQPEEYGDDAFLRSMAKYNGNRDMIVDREEWDERQQGILGHNGVMAIRVEMEGGKLRARELWRTPKALNSVIPSPLVLEGIVYVVRNGGILLTLAAASGRIIEERRITGALGGYSSSPVAAEGKIYFANEDGKVAVVKAGREWEVLAVNELDEAIHATPALSGGQVYLRTSEGLYRFEEGQ